MVRKTKKQKKCTINNTDKVLFGDGGSSAIVVITKDKRVYKIFTLYNFTPAIELDKKIKDKKIKDNNIEVENEIKIYELLTKNIINKDISNHIVKYIDSNNCKNAKSIFSKCPKSYVEFMRLAEDQKTKMCQQYFRNHPNKKVNDEYKVVEIEHCDYSCADFIRSKIADFINQLFLYKINTHILPHIPSMYIFVSVFIIFPIVVIFFLKSLFNK